jgi:hypothetical protein
MRNKRNSKNPDYYIDFGCSFKENDPCIFYSAAKSYLKKSGGLCLSSEIHQLDKTYEIIKILTENQSRNQVNVYENSKIN